MGNHARTPRCETSTGRAPALASLTAGTRVSHPRWETTGTVRVSGDGLISVKWDGHFTEDEISDGGPVRPEDVEIIPAGAP